MIGRKSSYSEELANLNYDVKSRTHKQEHYQCIVLDVCGAHKPQTRFIEETFDKGIWFILGCKNLREVFAVSCPMSYDELRFIYGNDENIVGRKCILHSRSARAKDLRFGNITFTETRKYKYQDEEVGNFTSISGLYDMVSNYDNAYKSLAENSEDGDGEIWKVFK